MEKGPLPLVPVIDPEFGSFSRNGELIPALSNKDKILAYQKNYLF